jgi:hypothetical protein
MANGWSGDNYQSMITSSFCPNGLVFDPQIQGNDCLGTDSEYYFSKIGKVLYFIGDSTPSLTSVSVYTDATVNPLPLYTYET